jgi:hypothetical protein
LCDRRARGYGDRLAHWRFLSRASFDGVTSKVGLSRVPDDQEEDSLERGSTQVENFFLLSPSQRELNSARETLGGEVHRLAPGADSFNHGRREKGERKQASYVAIMHTLALRNCGGVLRTVARELGEPTPPPGDGFNERGFKPRLGRPSRLPSRCAIQRRGV